MKNKGVTLIVLVITIIVLLILVGVSITMIVGRNGIVSNATTVEIKWTKGEVKEAFEVLVNERLLDAYSKVKDSTKDISTEYNEKNIITYFTNPNEDGKIYLHPYNISETIPTILTVQGDDAKNDDGTTFKVYQIYYIDVAALERNISEKYVNNNPTSLENLFALEVQTQNQEDGTKKSTGTYKLYYYSDTGDKEELAEYQFYRTNES